MPAVAERFFTRPEFLQALGISLDTFYRRRKHGVLPAPPRQGRRGVYTEAYLATCRRALERYRKTR